MTASPFFGSRGRRGGAVGSAERLSRRRALEFFGKLPRCLVGLEARASSHYWARELIGLGHEVKLDAGAIREALSQARQERGDRCGGDLRGGGQADHALRWRDEQIAADAARFRLPLQRVWLQLLGLAAPAKSMSKILRFMMRAISSARSGFWHSERGLSQKFDFGSKAKRSRAFAPRHDSGSVK
jgi:hypothetical protein